MPAGNTAIMTQGLLIIFKSVGDLLLRSDKNKLSIDGILSAAKFVVVPNIIFEMTSWAFLSVSH